ncbi:hypothetical protein EDC96DRAFT_515133 [Choanephora cucurbitarum]|nr:hypothetical protein EDC96DRAFT_515133 [Choanephora cucurbitarum]
MNTTLFISPGEVQHENRIVVYCRILIQSLQMIANNFTMFSLFYVANAIIQRKEIVSFLKNFCNFIIINIIVISICVMI